MNCLYCKKCKIFTEFFTFFSVTCKKMEYYSFLQNFSKYGQNSKTTVKNANLQENLKEM